MSPIFHEKKKPTGLVFKYFENLECFCGKITKWKWVRFFWKNPKPGYLFLDKLSLNMGMGPELPSAHPRLIQICALPPPRYSIFWWNRGIAVYLTIPQFTAKSQILEKSVCVLFFNFIFIVFCNQAISVFFCSINHCYRTK